MPLFVDGREGAEDLLELVLRREDGLGLGVVEAEGDLLGEELDGERHGDAAAQSMPISAMIHSGLPSREDREAIALREALRRRAMRRIPASARAPPRRRPRSSPTSPFLRA